MGNVIAPLATGSLPARNVLKHRGAVRHVHRQIAGWAKPNTATKGHSPIRSCLVLGDKSVLEMGGIRLGRNVDATALLPCLIAFDEARVHVHAV